MRFNVDCTAKTPPTFCLFSIFGPKCELGMSLFTFTNCFSPFPLNAYCMLISHNIIWGLCVPVCVPTCRRSARWSLLFPCSASEGFHDMNYQRRFLPAAATPSFALNKAAVYSGDEWVGGGGVGGAAKAFCIQHTLFS